MILISKNDSRSKLNTVGIPSNIVNTYSVAFADKEGNIGFCRGDESCSVLYEIIKSKSFVWSQDELEPIEMNGDYISLLTKRIGKLCIVFHEVNNDFINELLLLRNYRNQLLKERLSRLKYDGNSTLLWRVMNINPGSIYLGEINDVVKISRFISIWSYSDAGIYFHLYGSPDVFDQNIKVSFVNELP